MSRVAPVIVSVIDLLIFAFINFIDSGFQAFTWFREKNAVAFFSRRQWNGFCDWSNKKNIVRKSIEKLV